jgi:uncharacterized UPF0146 family protein
VYGTSYVDRLEIVECGVVPMKKLAKKLKDSDVDTSSIDLEKALKYYEEGRKLEQKRLSTTKTNLQIF